MNSKIGRKRKEIFVGKTHVSFTGTRFTSHGGMALVAQGMESMLSFQADPRLDQSALIIR